MTSIPKPDCNANSICWYISIATGAKNGAECSACGRTTKKPANAANCKRKSHKNQPIGKSAIGNRAKSANRQSAGMTELKITKKQNHWHNRQSLPIGNRQSAIGNRQSAIGNIPSNVQSNRQFGNRQSAQFRPLIFGVFWV